MKQNLVSCTLIIITVASSASASTLFQTSFEDLASGAFTELHTATAHWKTITGHAKIAKDAKKGQYCLHLMGGQETVVELTLPAPVPIHQLSFWGERWTRRDPFSFRILAWNALAWEEVYKGDETIKVGRRFLSHITVPLHGLNTQKFRLVCKSPENTGILIDEFCIERPAKMVLKSVTTRQTVAPALIGKAGNAIQQIQVQVSGNLSPLIMTKIQVNTLDTSSLADIDSVSIYYSGHIEVFALGNPFGSAKVPENHMTFTGHQPLTSGLNTFWVSYVLKPTADLFHRVNASCEQVRIQGAQIQVVKPEPGANSLGKRIGVALRDGGDDGVSAYRIPGLATTNQGTLIAVYDIRYRGWGDLPGHVDVGMSRSLDHGQTWESMKIIMDMGEPHDKNGIGDPSILVDRKTGTIWVAALWSHGNRAWHGSGSGLTPQETGQVMLVKSDDDGKTWSGPVNITEQIKKPAWRLLLQGPGKGICLRNGTLVFPAQFKDPKNLPHSTIIYSQDHGQTWKIGTGAKTDTTEAQVVELNNGALMLNMRDNRGGARSVYITRDMGQTWIAHATSRQALPEPVCMASLIRFASTQNGDPSNVLLFSNPAVGKAPRRHMTIKASKDEGQTWPDNFQRLIYEPPSAGYSCMTKIDEFTFGILYEGGQTAHLIFEAFHIDEIMGQ